MFDFDELEESHTTAPRPTLALAEKGKRCEYCDGHTDGRGAQASSPATTAPSDDRDEDGIDCDDDESELTNSDSDNDTEEEPPEFLEFPPSFTFGVATAAYQIEGAAAEGGRKPSIWDDFAREKGRVAEGATGDVACDHYHRFRTDVGIMARLGMQAYRFSISWSRLIPDGEGAVNEEAVHFYRTLIDELLAHSIEPWVTLYHWDLPSALQASFGGWLGPKQRISKAFSNFARVCFDRFGSKVKRWMTINEPYCVAALGYANGILAPGNMDAPAIEPYIVAHNLLLAHAAAVRVYRSEFAAKHRGQIGIVLNVNFRKARDSSDELDVRAAQRALDFELGWFADPIWRGDYPERMRTTCGDRLPVFTGAEKRLLQDSSDFLGINYYSSVLTMAPTQASGGRRMSGGVFAGRSSFADMGVTKLNSNVWETTDTGWYVTPWGLREVLQYAQKRYAPPQGLVVTENGCAWEPSRRAGHGPDDLVPKPFDPKSGVHEDFDGETFVDAQRVRFLRSHLCAVHEAIASGTDVRGYFVWSLLDNFEWGAGYAKRFGIVRVDYKTQKRTIKASGRFYATVIKDRGLYSQNLGDEEELSLQPRSSAPAKLAE